MLFHQAAQLIYDGAGMHEIRNLVALQQDSNALSTTDNRALAEFIMRKIDYANSLDNNKRFELGNIPMKASREVSREINHIHHNCQEEIESKWQPRITDAEAHALMFQETIESELAGAAKNQTIELKL